ncbi:SpoIIE family protein phosphatase [Marinomonas sp.]
MKLLCIDSEAVYREIVTLCAESEGLEVKSAGSVEQALALFENWRPDIVCLDYLLQGGNGLDLVKQFKILSGTRYVPMIFLTSHASDSVMDLCFKAGADDFLPKPFHELLFSVRLKKHIEHVQLINELYEKNTTLTYYQTINEREHEMAHQVLGHILQRNDQNSDTVAITHISAASFNGDLALIKTRADGAKLIFVGDFTGHGLSASIGALPLAQTFFDAADECLDLESLTKRINRILNSILPDYMFCAAYVLLLEPNKRLSYWGGGMPNAYIRKQTGSMTHLSSQHMPLGVLPNQVFESNLESIPLSDGDSLVIVSDGVLELKAEDGVMLGQQATEALIGEHYQQGNNISTAQQGFQQALANYSINAVQDDDITIFSLRA